MLIWKKSLKRHGTGIKIIQTDLLSSALKIRMKQTCRIYRTSVFNAIENLPLYAIECGKAIFEYAKSQLDIKRIVALIDKHNTRSWGFTVYTPDAVAVKGVDIADIGSLFFHLDIQIIVDIDFTKLISSTHVEKPKPAPDSFLLALKELGCVCNCDGFPKASF